MYSQNTADAIGHTPLIEVSQISPNKGVRVLAKMEGQSVGGSASVKD